ncbi:uncharacterized protein TNCV_3041371 [Trichonephila clavipes]|nr:uncharacterized protein TNCV_3041371 [Trichonephila clavipes]
MRIAISNIHPNIDEIIRNLQPHTSHYIHLSAVVATYISRAVGSLVVRASDSRPEGLGSMLDVTKYPPSAHGFTCRNCGGGDRGRVAIYRPFGEVSLSLNRTVTRMVLKANDRRTSCPCHDEFRGPRSDYVRQNIPSHFRRAFPTLTQYEKRRQGGVVGSHRQSSGASLKGGNVASKLSAMIDIRLYDAALKIDTSFRECTRSVMERFKIPEHRLQKVKENVDSKRKITPRTDEIRMRNSKISPRKINKELRKSCLIIVLK